MARALVPLPLVLALTLAVVTIPTAAHAWAPVIDGGGDRRLVTDGGQASGQDKRPDKEPDKEQDKEQDKQQALRHTQREKQSRNPPNRLVDRKQNNPVLVPTGSANYTMDMGVVMVGSFAGLAAAYGPALSIGRRTSDHVLMSLFLAGPAFGKDQKNAAGSVAVRHEMAALQADLMGLFWGGTVLRTGIGAGLCHVHIDGRPTLVFPQQGHSEGGFSWMLSGSAGVVVNLRSDIGLFVDGRMFVLTPTPVVLLNGLEVGRAGNPGISIATGVEVRL